LSYVTLTFEVLNVDSFSFPCDREQLNDNGKWYKYGSKPLTHHTRKSNPNRNTINSS